MAPLAGSIPASGPTKITAVTVPFDALDGVHYFRGQRFTIQFERLLSNEKTGATEGIGTGTPG
jgi:hypothetical protein